MLFDVYQWKVRATAFTDAGAAGRMPTAPLPAHSPGHSSCSHTGFLTLTHLALLTNREVHNSPSYQHMPKAASPRTGVHSSRAAGATSPPRNGGKGTTGPGKGTISP